MVIKRKVKTEFSIGNELENTNPPIFQDQRKSGLGEPS